MKFSVAKTNGQVTNYDGHFRLADSGVLRIEPTGDERVILLSPAGWLSVEVRDAPPGMHFA
jgi:hypothetical protein